MLKFLIIEVCLRLPADCAKFPIFYIGANKLKCKFKSDNFVDRYVQSVYIFNKCIALFNNSPGVLLTDQGWHPDQKLWMLCGSTINAAVLKWEYNLASYWMQQSGQIMLFQVHQYTCWHYLLQQQCGRMNLEYSMKVVLAPCFIITVLRNFNLFFAGVGRGYFVWVAYFVHIKEVIVNHWCLSIIYILTCSWDTEHDIIMIL